MSTDTITYASEAKSLSQGRWRIDPDALERRVPHAHPLGVGDRQGAIRPL